MTPPATPRAVAVHPRLRARRIAVQRAEGRRRLRRLGALAVVASVVAAAWGAASSPLLDVDRISVTGADHLSASAVEEASGIDRGTPLVSVDPGAVEQTITRLPWVHTAEVRREWPGTVRIAITERTPLAVALTDDGGWGVLDATGRVLEVVRPPEGVSPADVKPPLPLVAGVSPGAAGSKVGEEAAGLRVLARLPADIVGAVQSVTAPDGDVVLQLAGGGEVRFGDASRIEEKVLAVATVLQKVDLGALSRLDVSVPGSPVLTRR